ncbi:MAG: MBL fold metallo-hydrolase [Solirubrobacterales bacterium]|nr:MBL fold metallo-hydrolase [Solirubrobacterales bacterium]MBV9363863.1 MBL fold metallo-hydrolase [Solirubrobacterales bacterium]MBV9807326.1 MBL fold metallo-hydrolase [Solirubrobacterales bacterium]
MRIEWYGQAAFRLSGSEGTVFIDPIGDTSGLASRGITLDYPALVGVNADLVLVTHEHADHNGVEMVGGDPAVLRSTAGRLASPIGEVIAIASEHDEAAGTERGPNTIFAFALEGLRLAHFGDFGQRSLREEQAAALGEIDMVFLPIGAGPTIGPEQAAAIVERLSPRWVVPMHYRTHRVSFLDPPDAFLERMSRVHRLDEPGFDTETLPSDGRPLVVLPAVP